MPSDNHNLQIVFILTAGFGLASILGYITQRLHLSSMLGYLIAGYLIGPYSPGYTADEAISEQLAEIGVVLMLFGVGLHFKLNDLVQVRRIAVPGAIAQTCFAAALAVAVIHHIGWSIEAGIVVGVAIGVASTVVMVRVLSDHNLLATSEGHVAIGWLIVEDILTVIVLLLLPTLAASEQGFGVSVLDVATSIAIALFKFIALGLFMFTVGSKFVSYALHQVARTRSHELFTLTVLALTFCIATGSTLIFGTSIALGAFVAGMVVGRTAMHHQVLANAFPLRDAFVVIFFLSVGMLFQPSAILSNLGLFLTILSIVMIAKPLIAFVIVLAYRYPVKTAMTVAIALAQIGEFSFILAEEASRLKILPDEGYDILIACALVSISLNPLLFRWVTKWSLYLESSIHSSKEVKPSKHSDPTPRAIIVGYGPIGRSAAQTLEKIGYVPTIIDRNVDTISTLLDKEQPAVYGDAALPDILKNAHLETAKLLVITVPDVGITDNIIHMAMDMNPKIQIVARARYLADVDKLNHPGVTIVCGEEEELSSFDDVLLGLSELGVAPHIS